MQIIKYLKRIIKCVLIFTSGIIAILGVLVGITIINTLLHQNKFRFENFETAEELIDYIKTNFPNGSDSKPLIDLLEGAGAKCNLVPEKHYSKADKEAGTCFLYHCSYNVGLLYFPQLMHYDVILRTDQNQKIMASTAGRYYAGP